MIVSATAEIDPIYLLLHEPDKFTNNLFNDYVLARAMNAAIHPLVPSSTLARVEMIPPSDNGLGRWSVEWQEWGKDIVRFTANRGERRPSEVRKLLPSSVAGVLRALSHKDLDLGGKP